MPSTIEDFDIGLNLGQGGFASVYSARNRKNGDLVAIKMVDKAKMIERGFLDRVWGEVKVHSML